MSFTDRLVLWLHIAFAIFTIGPVSAAIMSTPRYIRARNLTVVRYLYRTTRLFVLISLGVLVFGIILAQQLDDFAKPWLTISMTLFVVAIVLLLIVLRDQRRAVSALELAEASQSSARQAAGATLATTGPGGAGTGGTETGTAGAGGTGTGGTAQDTVADAANADGEQEPAGPASAAPGGAAPGSAQTAGNVATVERGRIVTLGAVVTVIWLVILVLMVWR
jgi:hypothetical protein